MTSVEVSMPAVFEENEWAQVRIAELETRYLEALPQQVYPLSWHSR